MTKTLIYKLEVINLYCRQNRFAVKPTSDNELISKFQIGKNSSEKFRLIHKKSTCGSDFFSKFTNLFSNFFRGAFSKEMSTQDLSGFCLILDTVSVNRNAQYII